LNIIESTESQVILGGGVAVCFVYFCGRIARSYLRLHRFLVGRSDDLFYRRTSKAW